MVLMKEAGIKGWRRHVVLKERVKRAGERTGGVKVRPDFVFRRERVVVFVDGCFWHGCPRCYVRPKQNRKFWDAKVIGNQTRDRKVSRVLKKDGWKVLRIWECALTQKVAGRTIGRLHRALAV